MNNYNERRSQIASENRSLENFFAVGIYLQVKYPVARHNHADDQRCYFYMDDIVCVLNVENRGDYAGVMVTFLKCDTMAKCLFIDMENAKQIFEIIEC